MPLAARRITALQQSLRPLMDFLGHSEYARRRGDPDVADFVLGNPQEMPLQGLVEAVQHHVVPQDKNWFAYAIHNHESADVVARSLEKSTGLPFEADDVLFAPGTFGGLATALRGLVD